MAEYVYVIGPLNGPFKIGYSRDVQSRLASLQIGSPVELKIHYHADAGIRGGRCVENYAHWLLRSHRRHGEWFSCLLGVACEAIATAIEQAEPMPIDKAHRTKWLNKGGTKRQRNRREQQAMAELAWQRDQYG